jgi:hypothetical protein
MNKLEELLEFLYYSIIIFVIIIFFTIILDIVAQKVFPNDDSDFILGEIFILWLCISVIIYYTKKFIHLVPSPFPNSTIHTNDNNNINNMMIIILIPVIVSWSIKNIRNKTQSLYKKFEGHFS